MTDNHPLTVVVGADGSPASQQAIREGARLARGGTLVIVHARETVPAQLSEQWRDVLDHDHETEAQALLERVVRETGTDLSQVTLQTRAAPGPPAQAIVHVANDVGADFIVVGSHGYGALTGLLGSVSRSLVRQATAPVVVIPPACAEQRPAAEAEAKAVVS